MALRDYVSGPTQGGLVSRAMRGLAQAHKQETDRTELRLKQAQINAQMAQAKMQAQARQAANATARAGMALNNQQAKEQMVLQERQLRADTANQERDDQRAMFEAQISAQNTISMINDRLADNAFQAKESKYEKIQDEREYQLDVDELTFNRKDSEMKANAEIEAARVKAEAKAQKDREKADKKVKDNPYEDDAQDNARTWRGVEAALPDKLRDEFTAKTQGISNIHQPTMKAMFGKSSEEQARVRLFMQERFGYIDEAEIQKHMNKWWSEQQGYWKDDAGKYDKDRITAWAFGPN